MISFIPSYSWFYSQHILDAIHQYGATSTFVWITGVFLSLDAKKIGHLKYSDYLPGSDKK